MTTNQTTLGKVGIANKGNYSPDTTYNQCDFVFYEGSTWLALKNGLIGIEPIEGENWKYLARGFEAEVLSLISANDISGIMGDAGKKVNAQSLIDVIADKVATKLIEKGSIVNNAVTTVEGTVLDGRMGKALQDQITDVNNNINGIFKSDNNIPDDCNNCVAGFNAIRPSTPNSPYSFWASVLHIVNGGEDYKRQFALPWGKADRPKYRIKDAGIWQEWETLVTNSDLPIMEGKVLNPNGDIANITLSYPVKAGGYLHAINGNYEVNDFIVIGARVGATERQNITVKLSKTVNQNIQINVFYIPSY